MTAEWQLAQCNVATMRGDRGDPIMAGFYDCLEQLWQDGPAPGAFTFRERFGPDGEPL